ncbi:diacylglycerol kinase family protein [Candidatus Sulfidibacterium hydrothermale]|uniref:diacylglycerol kinase family protein n=1 Tax=Candidatus Sulfidibacterium hydrothermale TaxID=2875962 RepID=UPI0021D3F751|nr:diacylglycerol kinase family protein [Candidatus Sulfidibacterium hydrothermale]UBM63186.1 diacylglycerol kinase family protein [Candidatus Sulfidibacterium hydrothermale]
MEAADSKKSDLSSGSFSFRKRARSFVYAWRGIRFMLKTQHNFWIHLTVTFLVVVAGILLNLSLLEWLFIILAIGLVLAAETFNTAVEQLTDIVHPEWGEKAAKIKDLAAGAVLICALTAALIGVFIFAPKIWAWL